MGRLLLNLITLGMYGFVKGKPTGNRRLGRGSLKFETFGVPSEKVARKILQKFMSDKEAEIVLARLELRAGFFVKDEAMFNAISDAFEKAKFPLLVSAYRHAYHDGYRTDRPRLFNSNGEYEFLEDYDLCHSCGSNQIIGWYNPGFCDHCGSNRITVAAKLTDEEFDKHVKTLSKEKAKRAKATTTSFELDLSEVEAKLAGASGSDPF